jgi:hypothetical protein
VDIEAPLGFINCRRYEVNNSLLIACKV